MIPSLLIVGTTVGRTQVERVIGLHVLLQTEGNPHKATGSFTGLWCRRAGNLRLDNAVGEFEAVDGGKLRESRLFVGSHRLELALRLLGHRDPQPQLGLQRRWRRGYVM